MIARVRIAPMERWCEPVRNATLARNGFGYPEGMTVEIETGSMFMNPYPGCGGKCWMLTARGCEETAECGADSVPGAFFCEHMLEMD